MIQMKSNMGEVLGELTAKLQSFTPGGVGYGSTLREIATTMRAEIGRRVHSDGKNAEGGQIGNYSAEYAAYRKKKGRPIDKVNLSLTGQLSNQFVVVETSNSYGLGWADTEKQQRAVYLEERYGKVWALTSAEAELSQKIADQKIQEIFN